MTNARLIACEHERRTIPAVVLEIFEDMTNAALASLMSDTQISVRRRMQARLELEYREAFGILVDWGPDGAMRRLQVDDETIRMLEREAVTGLRTGV